MITFGSSEFSGLFENTFFYRDLQANAFDFYIFVCKVVKSWQKLVFPASIHLVKLTIETLEQKYVKYIQS